MSAKNGTVAHAEEPVTHEAPPLTKDEVEQAATLDRQQIRAVVDLYYQIQKVRVGARNRESACERRVDVGDPHLVTLLKGNLMRVENMAARAMKAYAEVQPLCIWAMSIPGISTVLATSLHVLVDVAFANTAGAVWSHAGLNPDMVWERGQRRPYCARLKTVCWQIGEMFKRAPGRVRTRDGVRTELREATLYERLYRERKEQEVARNEAGRNADQARARLDKAFKRGSRISPEQKEIWASGKLQAKGLDLRAMRYAVKIFLSHYHTVGRTLLGLPIVKPWVLEHGGHAHYIAPPNWELVEELMGSRDRKPKRAQRASR